MVYHFNKLPVTVQVALKYGLYSSLLLMAVLLGLFYADRHPMLIPIIFDVRIFLLAIFMFFAIREFRDLKNNGELHMWQGLVIGMVMALTMGLLAALFILIFGAVEDAFLADYLNKMTLQLTSNKEQFLEAIGEEAYENTLSKLPSTTVAHLALDYFLKNMGIAFFLVIIISIILRRQSRSTTPMV